MWINPNSSNFIANKHLFTYECYQLFINISSTSANKKSLAVLPPGFYKNIVFIFLMNLVCYLEAYHGASFPGHGFSYQDPFPFLYHPDARFRGGR